MWCGSRLDILQAVGTRLHSGWVKPFFSVGSRLLSRVVSMRLLSLFLSLVGSVLVTGMQCNARPTICGAPSGFFLSGLVGAAFPTRPLFFPCPPPLPRFPLLIGFTQCTTLRRGQLCSPWLRGGLEGFNPMLCFIDLAFGFNRIVVLTHTLVIRAEQHTVLTA